MLPAVQRAAVGGAPVGVSGRQWVPAGWSVGTPGVPGGRPAYPVANFGGRYLGPRVSYEKKDDGTMFVSTSRIT